MPRCPQCGNEYDGGTHFCALPVEEPPKARAVDARLSVSRVHDPGTVLGSYVLRRLLGEGAIGRVYQAEHRTLGRQVAVKVLRSEFAEKPAVVKRFFGEARAVNQIAHENIVEITDFVEQDDGTCYYIMELLDGETLDQRFSRTGVIPVSQLIRVAMQITRALQAVHDQSIVHRDLKPENVFLTTRGDGDRFVKVLDFGVAKLARGQNTHTTVAGMLVGTPDYMSPEQAVGGEVDHRADIYSLGAVLYEMSTGRKVFAAPSLRELLDLHLSGRAIPPRELASLPQPLPPRFEELVMRCLAKEPSQRPQSMRELEEELRAIADETSDLVRVVMTEGRRPNAIAIMAVMVLVMLPVFAVVAAVTRRAPPVRIQPISKVSVQIDTEPEGARVLHVESGREIGSTPLTTELDRSTTPQHFRLMLQGFEAHEHAVTPDEPHRATIALRPQRPNARAHD